MLYMGVDPGVSGGVAGVRADGTAVFAHAMPATERDVLELFLSCVDTNGLGNVRAVLEFVRSSPQMGVVSAFKFGCGYGGLRMALSAARIPYEEAIPRKWQGALSCLTKGDKNVTKRKAQDLFADAPFKITHAVADALLIAEYCRRIHLGTAQSTPRRASKARSTSTGLF